MRRLILALALYALLSVFDWASTMYVVEAGIAYEAYPIMAQIFSYGWGAGLVWKLAIASALALSCCLLYRLKEIGDWLELDLALGGRGAAWFAVGVNLAGITAVLVYNFAQLAQ